MLKKKEKMIKDQLLNELIEYLIENKNSVKNLILTSQAINYEIEKGGYKLYLEMRWEKGDRK